MNNVIERLQDYCDCLPDVDDTKLRKSVDEMIHLISLMTCWQQNGCETLFHSPREEIVDDVPTLPCDCCINPVLEFEPFYKIVDATSFEVKLVEVNGIHETVTTLTPDQYEYSFTDEVLRIDTSSFAQRSCCATCNPPKYRLIVDYNAGYPELPDCLLPVLCTMLHVLLAKNSCDCSACQACRQAAGDISEVDEVDYNDSATPKLESLINQYILANYQRQLSMVSLCKRGGDIWLVKSHQCLRSSNTWA